MNAQPIGDNLNELYNQYSTVTNMTAGSSETTSTGLYSANYVTSPTYWWPTYSPQDKGRQAFEIIKKLQEKKIVELRTAKQFSDLMDAMLEIL